MLLELRERVTRIKCYLLSCATGSLLGVTVGQVLVAIFSSRIKEAITNSFTADIPKEPLYIACLYGIKFLSLVYFVERMLTANQLYLTHKLKMLQWKLTFYPLVHDMRVLQLEVIDKLWALVYTYAKHLLGLLAALLVGYAGYGYMTLDMSIPPEVSTVVGVFLGLCAYLGGDKVAELLFETYFLDLEMQLASAILRALELKAQEALIEENKPQEVRTEYITGTKEE
jgi:xanthosine utilization system XapX-like protein